MKKKNYLIIAAVVLLCYACGVKEDESPKLSSDNSQKTSSQTKDERTNPATESSEEEKEVFTLDDKEYVIGVDVDKEDVLVYQSGKMSKESLESRIIFKQRKNIINEAFEKELPKHNLDTEYKKEIYSALDKCKESFFAPDEENHSRQAMSYVHLSDYQKEYKMIEELGKEAVPYICSYVADDEDWNLYFLLFMDLSLQEMTGFKAEDYDLSDEELEVFNEFWKGKAYIILAKYCEG